MKQLNLGISQHNWIIIGGLPDSPACPHLGVTTSTQSAGLGFIGVKCPRHPFNIISGHIPLRWRAGSLRVDLALLNFIIMVSKKMYIGVRLAKLQFECIPVVSHLIFLLIKNSYVETISQRYLKQLLSSIAHP